MRAHGVSKSLTHSADAATAPSTPGSSTLATPTVLVVDDEPLVRALLTDALQIEGFNVVTAASGLTALDHVASSTFSSAILDMRMPGMSGLELARLLKNDPDYRDVPILAWSACAMDRDRQQCLDAGCDNYISKPFTIQELEECILHLVSGTGRNPRTGQT